MTPSTDPAASSHRRPHRKSRNGCQQCKRKKIKRGYQVTNAVTAVYYDCNEFEDLPSIYCDECKPSCGHCKRFSAECSFLGTSTASSTSPLPPDTIGDLLGRNTSSSPAGLPATTPLENASLLFEVKDLELLHFYTTTTSLTVSNLPERQRLWQQVVPQISFAHPFLLRGILALSALHLARSQPERRAVLCAQASVHHDIGLRLFRAAVLNINPQNCDACFAFSSILVIHSWASSDQRGDLFFSGTSITGEKVAVEWVGLLRGVQTLLSVALEWIENGPMALILRPWVLDSDLARAADPEGCAKLTALSRLWDSAPAKFNANDVAALNETLALLHQAHGLAASSSPEFPVDILSVALSFPILLPETFLAMVNQLQPEALILLAHYSLLLNQIDQVWFMNGMSRHLLKTIQSKIGKEWESWIAWPLQDLILNESKN